MSRGTLNVPVFCIRVLNAPELPPNITRYSLFSSLTEWQWISKNSLLIDQTFQGKTIHAHYSSFDVSGDDYRIHVSGYSGNAGDSLRIDNGMAFSTVDNDNDLWVGDCSKTRGGGGWWYNGCSLANLNGRNFGKPTESYEGILWYFYANDKRSFKSSKMMLRKK